MTHKIKSELQEYIKKYVSYDNYLKEQNAKLLTIRKKKKNIEEHILYTIKNHNLKNIEINLPDGSLSYYEKDSYTPLNIEFLEQALINYYSSVGKMNPIDAAKKMEEVLSFVLEQRDKKTIISLKRSFQKY